MTVYKPDYYDEFTCIADKCDYTCCMQWNIHVDKLTEQKWKKIESPDGDGMLSDRVVSNLNGGSISLRKDGNCPYLKDNGLCSIVLKYGEEMLSDTCHSFPRERKAFSERVEYFLSVGCKEALSKLWSEDTFTVLAYTDADSEKLEEPVSRTDKIQFDVRDWLLSIMRDDTLDPGMTLKEIFYLLLELNEMHEEGKLDETVFEEYMGSEAPYELEQALLELPYDEPNPDRFLESNELLLDIFENYRKALIHKDIIEPIARQAEGYELDEEKTDTEDEDYLNAILMNGKSMDEVCDHLEDFLETVWEPFSDKLRLLLCEEIYASFVSTCSDFSIMVRKAEWLIMEYAVLRQWMFLFFDMNGKLDDEDMLSITAALFRIMGYCDEDILEYLNDSFESDKWDFGYAQLLI